METFAKNIWNNIYTNSDGGRKQVISDLKKHFPERLIATLDGISRSATIDDYYYKTFLDIVKFWYKNSKKEEIRSDQ